MKRFIITSVLGILAMSCATYEQYASVKTILESTDRYDGRRVIVRGNLSSRHGILNLFTRGAKQCIGLVLPPAERATLSRYVEREISLAGTFQAEGCGRDGICDEHLCGPGVLTQVSLSEDESRK